MLPTTEQRMEKLAESKKIQRESINEKLKTQKKQVEQGLMSRIFSRSKKNDKEKTKNPISQSTPDLSTIPEVREFQQLQQSATSRINPNQSLDIKSSLKEAAETRENTIAPNRSKYSLGEAFLQHQQRNSIVPNQLEVESEADQKAEKLLKTIIKFFSDNEKHLTIVKALNGKGLSGRFDEKKIE